MANGLSFLQGDWKSQTQSTLANLVDFTLTIHALLVEKGLYSQEEFERMQKIVKDGRSKLNRSFSFEDGMRAIRAAYRIEVHESGGNKSV